MSAQCVLLDRARHMPPPARESYIHRISREIAPTLLPTFFFCFFRAPGNNNNTYLRPSHGFGE